MSENRKDTPAVSDELVMSRIYTIRSPRTRSGVH